jgi:hypothetical protein
MKHLIELKINLKDSTPEYEKLRGDLTPNDREKLDKIDYS